MRTNVHTHIHPTSPEQLAKATWYSILLDHGANPDLKRYVYGSSLKKIATDCKALRTMIRRELTPGPEWNTHPLWKSIKHMGLVELNVVLSYLTKVPGVAELVIPAGYVDRLTMHSAPLHWSLYENPAYILQDLLGDLQGEILPRHGSGTTAEKCSTIEAKEQHNPLPESVLYALFKDHSDMAWWNAFYSQHRHSGVSGRGCARTICVPKDSFGPRVISAEPVAMQYWQAGLRRALRLQVKGSRIYKYYKFDDQKQNQTLAYLGSLDGSLATIDMSNASDELRHDVVMDTLKYCPRLRRWYSCTRTGRVSVDETEIPITTSSPMGSGVCFDIMSLVILVHTLSVVPKEKWDRVSVFGDDLIIPSACYHNVVDHLECIGFVVNNNKSFYQGYFRESCGKEYFHGIDCSPLYFRVAATDESGWQSLCSLYNHLYIRGYRAAAKIVLPIICNICRPAFSHRGDIGLVTDGPIHNVYRYDSAIMETMVKYTTYEVKTAAEENIDDYLYSQSLMRLHIRQLDDSAGSRFDNCVTCLVIGIQTDINRLAVDDADVDPQYVPATKSYKRVNHKTIRWLFEEVNQ